MSPLEGCFVGHGTPCPYTQLGMTDQNGRITMRPYIKSGVTLRLRGGRIEEGIHQRRDHLHLRQNGEVSRSGQDGDL